MRLGKKTVTYFKSYCVAKYFLLILNIGVTQNYSDIA